MIYPIDLEHVVKAEDHFPGDVHDGVNKTQIPSFFTGNIPPTPDGIARDTFLDLPGWFKVSRDIISTVL